MVGLWCRDEKEPALQWCCCPEIQYFPCVAIEVLADDDKDSHDPSRVIQNNRTGGAYCVGVPVSKGSSTAEQLPAVTLEAVWVAMPRSHLHFQQVAQLQGTFAKTIDWVLGESNCEARKKNGRRHAVRTGDLVGHLAMFTERRLVWWAHGGQALRMESVPWTHTKVEPGILRLSLDCARCIRVASGDARGAQEWEWPLVPDPFREWLQMHERGQQYFKRDAGSGAVDEGALKEWSEFIGVVEGLACQKGSGASPDDDSDGNTGPHAVIPEATVHHA